MTDHLSRERKLGSRVGQRIRRHMTACATTALALAIGSGCEVESYDPFYKGDPDKIAVVEVPTITLGIIGVGRIPAHAIDSAGETPPYVLFTWKSLEPERLVFNDGVATVIGPRSTTPDTVEVEATTHGVTGSGQVIITPGYTARALTGVPAGATALALNDAGHVLLRALADNGRRQAYLWKPDGMVQLTDCFEPVGLNAYDQIVCRTSAGDLGLWNGAVVVPMTGLDKNAVPTVLNDSGYVGGTLAGAVFRWRAGVTVTKSLPAGATIRGVTAINELGQILIEGTVSRPTDPYPLYVWYPRHYAFGENFLGESPIFAYAPNRFTSVNKFGETVGSNKFGPTYYRLECCATEFKASGVGLSVNNLHVAIGMTADNQPFITNAGNAMYSSDVAYLRNSLSSDVALSSVIAISLNSNRILGMVGSVPVLLDPPS